MLDLRLCMGLEPRGCKNPKALGGMQKGISLQFVCFIVPGRFVVPGNINRGICCA